MESFYLDRPLAFAHRGASSQSPANTLAAFQMAASLGADGIELDVQLSKDGEVVVIHDYSLDSTTDGQGLVGHKTLAELKRLDAGSWFGSAFAGQRIPTFQEVVDAVGGRMLLNIELKTVSLRPRGLVEAVVRIIEDNDLVDRVIVSSFNPLALLRVRRNQPRVAIGLLYAPHLPPPLRTPWLRSLVRPDALHPRYTVVDGAYVRWVQGQGYRLHAWTVDDADEMRRMARWGVDAIITSRPRLLREVLVAERERRQTAG
jgi:glycerophosphoryl diester phosphodiesterase